MPKAVSSLKTYYFNREKGAEIRAGNGARIGSMVFITSIIIALHKTAKFSESS